MRAFIITYSEIVSPLYLGYHSSREDNRYDETPCILRGYIDPGDNIVLEVERLGGEIYIVAAIMDYPDVYPDDKDGTTWAEQVGGRLLEKIVDLT